jgi:hypothetical protein
MSNPLDGIPIPRRLRRTEMEQTPEGDWYVMMHQGEQIVGIDCQPASSAPERMGGGGGGTSYYPRKPVVWILTDEVLTEIMGR